MCAGSLDVPGYSLGSGLLDLTRSTTLQPIGMGSHASAASPSHCPFWQVCGCGPLSPGWKPGRQECSTVVSSGQMPSWQVTSTFLDTYEPPPHQVSSHTDSHLYVRVVALLKGVGSRQPWPGSWQRLQQNSHATTLDVMHAVKFSQAVGTCCNRHSHALQSAGHLPQTS